LRPQVFPLVFRQGKHEVDGEPVRVAADLFIEAFDRDAIEGRQIGIQQDSLAANTDTMYCSGARRERGFTLMMRVRGCVETPAPRRLRQSSVAVGVATGPLEQKHVSFDRVARLPVWRLWLRREVPGRKP